MVVLRNYRKKKSQYLPNIFAATLFRVVTESGGLGSCQLYFPANLTSVENSKIFVLHTLETRVSASPQLLTSL